MTRSCCKSRRTVLLMSRKVNISMWFKRWATVTDSQTFQHRLWVSLWKTELATLRQIRYVVSVNKIESYNHAYPNKPGRSKTQSQCEKNAVALGARRHKQLDTSSLFETLSHEKFGHRLDVYKTTLCRTLNARGFDCKGLLKTLSLQAEKAIPRFSHDIILEGTLSSHC